MKKIVSDIKKALEENGRMIMDIDGHGIEIEAFELNYQIFPILRSANMNAYTIRGSFVVPNMASVQYKASYFGYEKYENILFANGTEISYKKDVIEKIKLFVSKNNWIDIHFIYKNGSYATFVIVPN